MAFNPRYIEIDKHIIHLLTTFVTCADRFIYHDFVVRADELRDILAKYTNLHTEYTKLFDAYFDAQAEIHALLLENKFLTEKINDNDYR